jgi:putative transposase
MTRYRRANAGSTFFFTVVSYHRRPILCDDTVRAALRQAIVDVRAVRPFSIDGWVLLPDHLHCVWTLPDGDCDYSTRWAQIKRSVSRACGASFRGRYRLRESARKHRDAMIWQRRFWEHRIRDELDMERHLDYIHFNPVRHGHVQGPRDWPYSTFHRYVRAGAYPVDWGGGEYLDDLEFE